jgi:hypothetical protein
MAKFHGNIGFVSSVETAPGVWTDVPNERVYYGEVIRQTKEWSQASQVNDNLTLGNRITVIGDDFANLNFATMRYVIWGGQYWKISSIEIQRPRLILSLGGLYNGPKVMVPPDPNAPQ